MYLQELAVFWTMVTVNGQSGTSRGAGCGGRVEQVIVVEQVVMEQVSGSGQWSRSVDQVSGGGAGCAGLGHFYY